MTAIVRRERARVTWLTGAAGLLLLAAAFTIMALAAPAHPHSARPNPVGGRDGYSSAVTWSPHSVVVPVSSASP